MHTRASGKRVRTLTNRSGTYSVNAALGPKNNGKSHASPRGFASKKSTNAGSNNRAGSPPSASAATLLECSSDTACMFKPVRSPSADAIRRKLRVDSGRNDPLSKINQTAGEGDDMVCKDDVKYLATQNEWPIRSNHPHIFYRSLMNLSIKKLSFVLIATAVLLGGCSKKPKRPDPSSTVLGPDGLSGSNIGGLDGGMVSDPNSGLSSRAPGDYSNGDRTALASQTVYFDFDQSGIKPSERSKLDFAKAYLDSNPGVILLLEGHCDWKGTPEYNLGLGDRRANAVKQYLTTLGVAADKLEVLSKGDLDSVEGADEATTARDRRVELVVLK